MKRKQPREMIESKEAKLQVETAADFDANDNAEFQQLSQQHLALSARQQPGAVKPDQNADTSAAAPAPAAAVQHHDHDSKPKFSHAQVDDISHGEPVILTRRINSVPKTSLNKIFIYKRRCLYYGREANSTSTR